MSATLAIAGRELRAYFLSPAGYVIVAMFLLFSGLLFFLFGPAIGNGFGQGQIASMRLFFSTAIWLFLLIAPAISMRVISDELRAGTLEMLLTSPVSEGQVILGKFFGSFALLLIMLAPSGLFVIALEMYGRPDYGELACGYLGLILAGAAFLASGVLASILTPSQVVAYLLTLLFWLCLLLATRGLPMLTGVMEDSISTTETSSIANALLETCRSVQQFLLQAEPFSRLKQFVEGMLDTSNVVYFVTITTLFLVSAVKALQFRRCP